MTEKPKHAQDSSDNTLLIVQTILAVVQGISGFAGLQDVISKDVMVWIAFVAFLVQLAAGPYLRSITTPASAVVARRTPGGIEIAGPASHLQEGEQVEVLAA